MTTSTSSPNTTTSTTITTTISPKANNKLVENSIYFVRLIGPDTSDNATPVAPPDREEVAMAIQRLKFNKTSGYDSLPAELAFCVRVCNHSTY